MNFNWKEELVMVTGSSTGLGRAIAIKAGELGAEVILVARKEKLLKDAADTIARSGSRGHVFPFDLERVEAIPHFYKKITAHLKKTPSVLINNAGYQTAGFVMNTPVDAYVKSLKVNALAPLALIQCVLPDMLRRKKGVIGNVMSSVMYRAFPVVSPVCASKSALGAIHESLKAELAGTPVRTIYIRPGSFKSEYWRNTDVGGRIKDYSVDEGNKRDPLEVAAGICAAIKGGREYFSMDTFKDKVGCHLSYWAPGLLEKIIISSNKAIIEKRPKV